MEALGIDIKLLLAQIINFALLLFLLTKFAYKPILGILEDRKQKIEDGLKDADAAKISLEKAESESEKVLQKAYDDANKILEDAKVNANSEISDMLKKASDQADRILDKAKEEAASIKEKTLLEAKSEISNVVTMALDKIVKDELDKTTKEKLTAKALTEL